MKKKKTLFVLILMMPIIINAQRISISIPKEANKRYSFVLNKGINQDTIQNGILSFTGNTVIEIPEKEKGYIGMGSLQIDGSVPLNIIISDENFEIEQSVDLKYKFKNSKENTYLYSIMQDRATPPQDTTLYATHFVNLVRFLQQLNKANTQGIGLQEGADIRLYSLEKLDIDNLYTSSIWYHIIDGIIKLSPNQEMLGNDMIYLLKRINSQEIFEHLANNLITITEQFGWDDTFDIIVPYLVESGRIKVPQGKMFSAFSLAKIRKGTFAPPIEGLKQSIKSYKAPKTLLIFYQPDCENCHIQMEKLIQNYPKLKQMGIRVISISSDTNESSNKQDIKQYPWSDEDKLCDLKGFAGKNFLNYGIMSTPTFFLLDKDMKVIKRYALVADIDFSAE